MSAPPYVIDASAVNQDADIWFALPAGFLPLPLRELAEAENGPAEDVQLGAALGPVLETLPDPAVRQQLLTDLVPVMRLAQVLMEAGTIHCSLGLHADDEGDGGLLLSFFTLAWRACEWAPRSVLAARAAAGAADAEHIETIEPPAGPAALVQSRLTGPPEAGIAAQRQLLQATAYVPCPDGRRIAILTLATTAVDHVHNYRLLLRDIAETVTFDNPLPTASDDVPDED
ncbi:hypothetical protein OK074_4736 [Actinobacteria bacterium OK074]|nr:hypothetical protein OK074_4736 [Actinobacteria bacterium OK074]